jgi:transcriptional regulator with XRE-family HTH domain
MVKKIAKLSPRSVRSADIYIGGRIRALRIEHGISQGELGQQLGISFQQIQKYEKGVNRISAAALIEIARVFKVAPAALLDGAPGVPSSATALSGAGVRFLGDPDGAAIARAFARIHCPIVRRALSSFVVRLAAGCRPAAE